MKKSISLLILSIFAGGILFYLTNFVLMPFDENGVLEIRNLSIVLFTACVFITTFVGAMHTWVDKFFIRKFYEKERAFVGIRRGLFVALTFTGIVYLKLFGFAVWYNVALLISIFILIEYLFVILSKKAPPKAMIDDKIAISKNSDRIEKEH